MKTIKTTLIILVASIFAISCSKPEDGMPGPAGETGAKGATGATGATGTANVIYSNWASAPVATAATIDGTNGNTTSIATTQLTQEILDKGTVLVYGKFAATVIPLPYVSYAGGSANTLTFFPELNSIKLFRFKHDGSGGVSIPTSLQFRYILIPGGTSIPTARKSQADFKKMSYSEVCHYLNIQE